MKEKSNISMYYSVIEASEIMGLSDKTVYAMCQRGYLPNSKVGSRVIIPKDQFHARLKELERKPLIER